MHLETTLSEVLEDGVIAVNKYGKSFKIDADSVIMSVIISPHCRAEKSKHVHLIGDGRAGNLRTSYLNALMWQ